MLARCLASLTPLTPLAALALSGCLVIFEDAVDVAGIAGPLPAAAEAASAWCMHIPGEEPSCPPVVISRETHDGIDWLRVDTGVDDEAPLEFLFFEHGGASWAFVRLVDVDDAPLTLMRVDAGPGRVVLDVPACGTPGEGAALAAAAREAGAEVRELNGCRFDTMDALMRFAASLPDDTPSGRMTFEP